MARVTRSRICGLTVFTLLMTRETVFIETPACFATSMIVALAMIRGTMARRSAVCNSSDRIHRGRTARLCRAAIGGVLSPTCRPRVRQLAREVEIHVALSVAEQDIGDASPFGPRR